MTTELLGTGVTIGLSILAFTTGLTLLLKWAAHYIKDPGYSTFDDEATEPMPEPDFENDEQLWAYSTPACEVATSDSAHTTWIHITL